VNVIEWKGGYDVANDEEVFSFILEDVLSFERGQEVGEMISVFLDPDISVQPFKGDVSIRGIIELQGEYDSLQETNEASEDVWNEETFEVRNFVDKVVDISEVRRIFSHEFPVEITIPSYRVSNMDDISMEIENFDYELLTSDQIKVQSSILIHGVHQERELEIPDHVDDELEPLFTIEPQEDMQAIEEAPPAEPVPDELEEEQLEVARENEDDHEDEIEPLDSVDEEKQLHISARSNDNLEEEDFAEEDDEEIEETTQDRNIDYLKSMFGGDEGNGQTKVRLCIVQDRDTVDSIAKKYDVKKSQLLKTNQLEDEDLVEGQLLHIPHSNHT